MKKLFSIIVGVFAAVAILLGYYLLVRFNNSENYDADEVEFTEGLEKEVRYLNDTVECELLVYGEDILFPQDLNYERIDNLEDSTIQRKGKYVCLIVNDLEGDVDITKEDFQRIIAYADRNANFDFHYLGNAKLDIIYEIVEPDTYSDDEMSWAYVMENKERTIWYIWYTDDYEYYKSEGNEYFLGEELLQQIYSHKKSNYSPEN